MTKTPLGFVRLPAAYFEMPDEEQERVAAAIAEMFQQAGQNRPKLDADADVDFTGRAGYGDFDRRRTDTADRQGDPSV